MKKGFTLLEMMIVLSVIALLFLLTLPHIQQKQGIIEKKGCEALIEVVNAQVLLYEIANAQSPTSIQELIASDYLKETQATCPDGSRIDIVDGEAVHD